MPMNRFETLITGLVIFALMTPSATEAYASPSAQQLGWNNENTYARSTSINNSASGAVPSTQATPGQVIVLSDSDVRIWNATANGTPSGWQEIGFRDRRWGAAVETPCDAYSSWMPPYPGSLWIWAPTCAQEVLFRKHFTLPSIAYSGILKIHADDGSDVYINGTLVGSNNLWSDEYTYDLTSHLVAGENVIAIRGFNLPDSGGGGGSAGVTFSAEIVTESESGTEFTINFTTFIPGNKVPALEPWQYVVCGLTEMYFEGDTRTFDSNSPSFRTRQLVTVIPDGSVDSDGIKDGTIRQNLTGITRVYASDALPILDGADDDGIYEDCHLLHEFDQASNSDMHIGLPERLGPKIIRIHFYGGAANPLVSPAPSIDWDLQLTIDATNEPATWQLTGKDDGFPAFEMYINGTPIYQRDSPEPYNWKDLSKLAPLIADKKVKLKGTLR
jgi:hypothetical protein